MNMQFTINITKDLIDYIWGWGGLIGCLLIPILVWFLGASRYENNKLKQEKQSLLNYLLTSAYRYFQYFVNLKDIISFIDA